LLLLEDTEYISIAAVSVTISRMLSSLIQKPWPASRG